jgi:hypothetical protein
VRKIVVLKFDCDRRFGSFGALDPQHTGPAADAHVLRKGDFRRHHEGHVYGLPLVQREVGPDEGASRTQVLGETGATLRSTRFSEHDRNLIRKALAATAFDLNLFRAIHPKQSTARTSPKEDKSADRGRLHRRGTARHHKAWPRPRPKALKTQF